MAFMALTGRSKKNIGTFFRYLQYANIHVHA